LIRVVAALIEREGRLLICQRRRGDIFALQWEFPGGKLRPCETPRAGLARELREELGCSTARVGPEIYRARHRYREMADSVEISFFAVCEISPAPRNLVFERVVWARPGHLPGYDFLPADRELVARLARGELARRLRRVSSARRPPPAPGRSRMKHEPGTVPLR
jgi:mutator protein MutT